MNKYKGEFEIVLDGKPHRAVFDWDAIAIVEERFGLDNLSALLKSRNLKAAAELAEIGLKRYHPEVTAEMVRAGRPPIVKTFQDIELAIAYAYNGPGIVPANAVGAEGDEKPGKKARSRVR